MISADDPGLVADLKQDEGTVLKPYKDTRGFLTIGTGRNLTANGVSAAEAASMLVHDIDTAMASLSRIAPWWTTLPDPQQRVMVNLCFNMGAATLATFATFLAFMQAGNWEEAANDLSVTAWYGEVGGRGPRTVARLLQGITANG